MLIQCISENNVKLIKIFDIIRLINILKYIYLFVIHRIYSIKNVRSLLVKFVYVFIFSIFLLKFIY
jgi:hypothetical protein